MTPTIVYNHNCSIIRIRGFVFTYVKLYNHTCPWKHSCQTAPMEHLDRNSFHPSPKGVLVATEAQRDAAIDRVNNDRQNGRTPNSSDMAIVNAAIRAGGAVGNRAKAADNGELNSPGGWVFSTK
jgi:hypothetical protein